MNFITIEFWSLVIITILGCSFCKNNQHKWRILGISGFIFYAVWDIRFLLLLIAYSLCTYIVAVACEKQIRHIKIFYVLISVALLGYFKYCNFFIDTFSVMFGVKGATIDIILPLGISFYILTSIGYVLDVYNKKYPAERDWLKVIVFITYFPKILSGPIERGNVFFEKLENIQKINKKRCEVGIQIILQGLIKKIVIADRLGVCVDAVFAHSGIYDGISLLCAVFTYSIQIYCDFAGYTDIAKGVSYLLGIPLIDNFNLPYSSQNSTEFWRRWHMSLSSWFRDYVYIPLGGSRKGKNRKYINTIVVMLISGLWHGANWTFVLWGGIHGIAQCFSNRIKGNKIINVVINFIFVTFTWTIFRAETIGDAFLIFYRIITFQEGVRYLYVFTPIYMFIVLLHEWYQYKVYKGKSEYILLDLQKDKEFAIFVGAILFTVALAYFGNGAFIYNNF